MKTKRLDWWLIRLRQWLRKPAPEMSTHKELLNRYRILRLADTPALQAWNEARDGKLGMDGLLSVVIGIICFSVVKDLADQAISEFTWITSPSGRTTVCLATPLARRVIRKRDWHEATRYNIFKARFNGR